MASITIIKMPFFDIFSYRPVESKHFIIDFDRCFDLT